MANVPDNRFIASTSLEEYFVDKDSGLPLAGGYVYFYRDISRTTPKLVYQLSGDPSTVGGYEFVPLPDPIKLSNTGTFVDDNDNNIAIYYFPYDGVPETSMNELDLYYVVVTDASGNEQFVRQAWPSIADDLIGSQIENIYYNQISNGQFVDVFFDKINTTEYQYSSGTTRFPIAPSWFLEIVATGSGNVNVTRNLIPGGPPVLTNPPYTLTIVPGVNLVGMSLVQRLDDNPGIWSRNTGEDNGYISGGLLLYTNSSVTMRFVPSSGTSKVILDESNATGAPVYYNTTVQLPVTANPSTPPEGFVEIYIDMPTTGAGTTLSSVQVAGLLTNQRIVPYLQQPVNRQKDYLFHYYNELLQYKPIKSYLVGWDFPINPAQFGDSGAISGSVNKSSYAWDQTIIYTSSSTGVSYERDTDGGLKITAVGGPTQVALVQYLSGAQVASILNNDLSVNVSVATSADPFDITGSVSLWYTTDALPNADSTGIDPNRSIVQTLNSFGQVNSTYGTGWVQVANPSAGTIPGAFILEQETPGIYFDIKLSGWTKTSAAAGSAVNFAIVVGFSTIEENDYIKLNSISLVPGKIATIPAPQSPEEVLRDCQQYYWNTYYESGNMVGAPTVAGAQIFVASNTFQSSEDDNLQSASSFRLSFPSRMIRDPSITIYSPQNGSVSNIASYKRTNIVSSTSATGSAFISNVALSLWSSSAGLGYVSKSSALFDMVGQFTVLDRYKSNSGGVVSPPMNQVFFSYHAVVDARLGIIN